MSENLTPTSAAEAEWFANRQMWNRRWVRLVLAVVPLIYLVYVGMGVDKYATGTGTVVGFSVLVAFAVCYLLLVVTLGGDGGSSQFWVLFAALVVLFAAELPFARVAAFVMCLYITIIAVIRFGVLSVPIVVALALAAAFVPLTIPSWHETLGDAVTNVIPIAIPVVAVVTLAVSRVVQGNRALADARAEVGRLGAENERTRIARDLHDLLGHSLTTITVKAGLARRLAESDPKRAVQEITEVEELSRRALSDVRSAVTNYHDVSLAGELARGKELLRASGIAVEVPTATDMVDGAHQELFGWVVREGLTNVARHAQATRCTVALGVSEVEISDDGIGGTSAAGNGLSGLRERVAAAGGIVEAGPLRPRGWRLRVALDQSRPMPTR